MKKTSIILPDSMLRILRDEAYRTNTRGVSEIIRRILEEWVASRGSAVHPVDGRNDDEDVVIDVSELL